MKKTKRTHKKPSAPVGRIGMWVVVLAILLGLANYAYKQVPSSSAATGPKIKFLTPARTDDLDFNSKYLVKFSVVETIPDSKPMALEFNIRDYEYDQNFALIHKMTLAGGQRSGSFLWRVGYDIKNQRIKWLPKNHLFLTVKIVGGNISNSSEFHVVPEDDGTGLPIVYLIDPNRGPDGAGPDGPYTIAIHGRNLTSKTALPTVYAVLFSNGVMTRPGTIAWKGYTSRRLTVSPPKWGSEPMVVDVTVTTDKGSYTVKNGFEFFSRI